MERYFKRKTTIELSSPPKRHGNSSKESSVEVELPSSSKTHDEIPEEICVEVGLPSSQRRHDNDPKESCVEVELSSPPKRQDRNSKDSSVQVSLPNLPLDPGLRTPILDYDPNIRDQVRRAYVQKGPCQPRNHTFATRLFSDKFRKFNSSWFDEHSNWLEYRIAKDAAFRLCCYLFKSGSGGDAFVSKGFSNWKKKDRLQLHVGGPSSFHNSAWKNYESLLNQKQHIETVFSKQSDESRKHYRVRLGASVKCVRLLLRRGLPFRGHDESEESDNKGNFLDLLEFLSNNNEEVHAVTLKNAPENHKLVSPEIQKDIANAFSFEIINAIIRDIGDAIFSILIDESRDISTKEQMAIVLRYVDNGHVIERFVGIEHVTSTTAISLKAAIDDFFSRHGLSISRLRGQGYDGASNMQGEYNGLKTLIMKENGSAYYVHCFTHQLQLAIVAVAKKHTEISDLFAVVAHVVNVVGASAKRRDILREKHAAVISEALDNNELSSGQGLHQETNLQRPGDTRWSSHHNSLISLTNMFTSVIDVLRMIVVDGKSDQKIEAKVLLESIKSFSFVFSLYLMKAIMGITNDLSQALQRKDQDIVNAMNLVMICKGRLQKMRETGWDSMLIQVSSFCEKHHIEVHNMDDLFLATGRPRRNAHENTNIHHYRVELLYAVIDMQLQELNNRFTETNTELLLCMACLNPKDSFSAFDAQKLIRFAQFYPKDFSEIELAILEDQLENYIIDMRSSSEFLGLKGITDLAQKMVETRKDKVYPLVYLLLTLALVLPVATATVERVFSAMNIVKTRLRSRMGDEWMNDSLLAYVEKDTFNSVDDEVVMQRFQNMKTRRGRL